MLALALIVAPQAAAQQLFDFNGQALIPASVGGFLSMYSIVSDGGGAIPTPLPLDFANYQYTIVVTNLPLLVNGFTQSYAGGSIALYEDNGTAANYASPATFTDGTLLLSGTFQNLSRTIFFPVSGTGSASGLIDWTGGTRLGEIAPADQVGWAFVSGISGSNVQPGYNENWDGKVEPQEPIVGTEDQSLGRIKSKF
jgi:hypothetical protein